MTTRQVLAFLFITLFALPLSAQKSYRIEDIPIVHLQDRTRYVSNPDGILKPATVAAIDTSLYALEKQTGIQILVVAVSQIEGGDCFDFAYRLGRKNGVGQKEKDNGLVILLSTNDRCIQFVTGYGLEGTLPDAVCKQIQTRYMNPYFKHNDWDTGMEAGIQAIRNRLDGTDQATRQPTEDTDGTLLLFVVLTGCFVVVPTLLWISARQRKRCPHCHKHTLNQMSERTCRDANQNRIRETVFLCSNCGHTVRRQRKINDDDDFHHRGGNGWPFLGGPFFGGGFGGRSGGDFGGGSFGGGDFGGGGAGSKF